MIQHIIYKNHIGTAEYSIEDKCYFGKLLNTSDLVLYEGNNYFDLVNNFYLAVDDYIEINKNYFKKDLTNKIFVLSLHYK